ncbi:MAG: alpha/beta hydrolase [Solirubrobacteraceae bacterium]|nr:alpha/beta hydrolase [Solirubrobacteraceae bacterium]
MQTTGHRVTPVGDLDVAHLDRGDGPLVACVHGFPDAMWSWSPLVHRLADSGYRAVAPALRGYAPTVRTGVGRPPRPDVVRLARDLLALADALGADDLRIVGHDWGAIVGYVAAALAPDRVRRLVAAGVPHVAHFLRPRARQLVRSRYMLWFQPPVVAERLVAGHDHAWLDGLIRRWSPTWDPSADELAALRRGLVGPDGASPALDVYRALVPSLLDGPTRRTLLASIRVPTLVVSGETDGCMGREIFAGQERWFTGGLEHVEIPVAGHFMHLERPERFAGLVLDHLVG